MTKGKPKKQVALKGGGVQAAADLLKALGQSVGMEKVEGLLDQVAKSDPAMAQKLKEQMVSLEDLKILTPKMLQELFRDIPFATLGLALRLGSADLAKHLFSQLSQNRQNELKETLLSGPKPVETVQKALQTVLGYLTKKVESGEFVIDKSKAMKTIK